MQFTNFFPDSRKFSTEEKVNCLRFFALQDIARKAMKMKFDTIVPGTDFENKWKAFETNCRNDKTKAYLIKGKIGVQVNIVHG